MRRHLKALLVTLLATSLVAAGCGDGNPAGAESPHDAVLAAFQDLDPGRIDIAVSIDATAAALAEALEIDIADPAQLAAVELLVSSEIELAGADGDLAVAFVVRGDRGLELRVVDQVLYVRVDTAVISRLVGQIDPEARAQLDEALSFLPFLAMEDPRLGFIGDLLDGGWVSLEMPPGTGLDDLWDTGTDPEALDEELTALIEAIVDENTVVTPDGQARGGDRYLVEVDIARLGAALAANPLIADRFGATEDDADYESLLAELEAEGVEPVWTLDVVLVNGALSSMRIDIADIASDAPAGATLPILVTFSASPTAPSAPAEHTPVPSELLEELLGGMMMGMGPMFDTAA